MIEGARRQKTPNEIALNIVLVSLTALFIVVVFVAAALCPLQRERQAGQKDVVLTTIPVLLSLIVCLIPTTIGGLLSAIGIAGIDRLMRRNVLATSGRAVEAAGDVDVLCLTRPAPSPSATARPPNSFPLRRQSRGTGRSRPTRLAGRRNARRPLHRHAGQGKIRLARPGSCRQFATFIPFTAQTRMSGVDLYDRAAKPPPVPPNRSRVGRHPGGGVRAVATPASAGRQTHSLAFAKARPRLSQITSRHTAARFPRAS